VFFKTAGCTYVDHFCYAYIDISSRCDGRFESSAFCPADTLVNLKAPAGFEKYTWFNANYSQVLGNQQTLQLKPAPASGTVFAVEITPAGGLGCTDTLIASLSDNLTVTANAGSDVLTCNGIPVQIGILPVDGLTYKWTPSSYLDNPDIANPVASPPVPTQYVLTVTSGGGGCKSTDTMNVVTTVLDNHVDLIGKTEYCIGYGPFPALKVDFADSIQWYKDSIAINGAHQTLYTVTQSGKYFARLFTNGCPLPASTTERSFLVEAATRGITYPVIDAAFNFPEPLHARTIGNSVTWTPATSLNNRFSYTPTFTGLLPQLYTIAMITTAGCITVDTQLVKTHKKIEIFVPTGFTVNGDGLNDRLKPILMGFTKVNYFRIYNRWGKLLYNSNSDQPEWDGKINNQPTETQTVVWMIEAVDVDGVVHRQQGTTILLR
jgi:gliding motility-associated-like protein